MMDLQVPMIVGSNNNSLSPSFSHRISKQKQSDLVKEEEDNDDVERRKSGFSREMALLAIA